MIFAAILRANRVLRKNVDKFVFFSLTLCITSFFVLLTPISAELIFVPMPVAAATGVFYDVFYFGISSQNSVSKYSVTGQKFWSITPEVPPVQSIQVSFNRIATLDGDGFIECRDTVFGSRLWKSDTGHFKSLLFQYPITYALRPNGEISAFDFNSGVYLFSGTPPPELGEVLGIRPGKSGEVMAMGNSAIAESAKDLTEWQVISESLPHHYRLIQADPNQTLIASNNIIARSVTDSMTPLFAMGSEKTLHHHYDGHLISVTGSVSTDSQWIISFPYLIEVSLSFSLVRVIDITTMAALLDWKEMDPDRSWRSVWWDNGLLGVLDRSHNLTIWDARSRRTLGAVVWAESDPPPLGMRYTHDVLSFVCRNKIAYALSRATP